MAGSPGLSSTDNQHLETIVGDSRAAAMSAEFPHSSSERHRKRCRSLSCALDFTSGSSSRPGSVSGRAILTPRTPSTTKSTLKVRERGAGGALESAWIQRLKPAASFNPNTKASNESQSTRQATGESRRGKAEPCKWIPDELASMPTNDLLTRVCEKAHNVEKSVSITESKENLLAATKSLYKYKTEKELYIRSQQSAALNNASKDLERQREGTWLDRLQQESSHGGPASCSQASQEALRVSPNANASLWIRQTEGHMRVVVPKATKGLSSSSGAAKERMVFSSSKLKAKAIDTRSDTPKTGTASQAVAGFGALCPSFKKPPLPPPPKFPYKVLCPTKAMLCRLDDSHVKASLNGGESEKAAWELSKRSSYIADEGENTCAKINHKVACKEESFKERADELGLSALALRNCELNFWEQLEKPQSSHARHHNFPSMSSHGYTWKNSWAEDSFAAKFEKRSLWEDPMGDSKPKSIEDLSTQLVLSNRSQELKSFSLDLPEFRSTRDISSHLFPCIQSMARYTDVKDDQNVDQLAPSDTEEDGADISLSQGTGSSDDDSISRSSPTSAVQLLSSAQDVHVFASSPLTVSLPSEVQKLSSWKYGVQSPPVIESGSLAGAAHFSKPNAGLSLNQRLCTFEERSQIRQHTEGRLDLNRSVQSSEEEDQTPSERLFLGNMEAKSSPVGQETRGQNFFHSVAVETEQPKYVLSTIMDDKQACGLFPSSAKRSRPDEHGAITSPKADADMYTATEGNRDEVKKCGLQSHHSWLHRWISPPCKSNHLSLSEPLCKPRENDKKETFLISKQIPGGGSFIKKGNDSFQAKVFISSALQERTPVWCHPALSAESAHRRIQFSAYYAPGSKEYNTPSAAALALAGTVAKRDHSPSARCKGLLENFPSAGMRHSSLHRRSLEVRTDPQARYDVQSAEHSNSSS